MSLLFKISDSLRVFLKSGRGISSLLEKGASVASTQILHNCKHYIPQVNTLLDAGANQGQFAMAANHFYPGSQIHSFEPLPAIYNLLRHNTRRIKEIHTYNYALGSSSGSMVFYSNAYSHASSALQVSDLQQNLIPGTAVVEQITVVVKRLDDVGKHISLVSPVLLKMDVQGFEKEILKGATHCLHQIDYLLFEASFVPMYNGEPLFDEMHSFVKELGFEFIAPVGFLQSEQLQILQMDLLYKRKR